MASHSMAPRSLQSLPVNTSTTSSASNGAPLPASTRYSPVATTWGPPQRQVVGRLTHTTVPMDKASRHLVAALTHAARAEGESSHQFQYRAASVNAVEAYIEARDDLEKTASDLSRAPQLPPGPSPVPPPEPVPPPSPRQR